MLSPRIQKFHRLVRAANDQPTEWLIASLKNQKVKEDGIFLLSRAACLRILVCRDAGIENRPSGLPYPQRRKLVRKLLRV